MLRRHGWPSGMRRALRAAGVLPSPWHPRRQRPLPDSLRDRLLAIPGTQPARRASLESRSVGDDLTSSWILASPLAPIAASFLVVVAVSLLLGNPYQVGAATLSEVREEVSPAALQLREGASRLAGVVAGVGEAAAGALPRAGLSASRAIAGTLQDRIGDQDAPPTHHREPAR